MSPARSATDSFSPSPSASASETIRPSARAGPSTKRPRPSSPSMSDDEGDEVENTTGLSDSAMEKKARKEARVRSLFSSAACTFSSGSSLLYPRIRFLAAYSTVTICLIVQLLTSPFRLSVIASLRNDRAISAKPISRGSSSASRNSKRRTPACAKVRLLPRQQHAAAQPALRPRSLRRTSRPLLPRLRPRLSSHHRPRGQSSHYPTCSSTLQLASLALTSPMSRRHQRIWPLTMLNLSSPQLPRLLPLLRPPPRSRRCQRSSSWRRIRC